MAGRVVVGATGTEVEAESRARASARRHRVRTVVLRTGYVLTQASLASQVAQFRRHDRGRRVLPAKAVAAGYQFRFPALEPALRDILQGEPGE
jgi:NAD dependent epimerase/dehydratase family enzyme